MNERLGAVLVAAGASRRMGFDKLWAPLGGRPVLGYALEVLARAGSIGRLVVVVAAERRAEAGRLAREIGGRVEVCVGGARRRDSVAAGLARMGELPRVLVHDAARPFLTQRLIDDGAAALVGADAAVAAVPVRDTIKRVDGSVVRETLRREELWAVQTPQLFRTEVLDRALRASDDDVTDEAALVERIGGSVLVYPGDETNRKLTTQADFLIAEALLASRARRTERTLA